MTGAGILALAIVISVIIAIFFLWKVSTTESSSSKDERQVAENDPLQSHWSLARLCVAHDLALREPSTAPARHQR